MTLIIVMYRHGWNERVNLGLWGFFLFHKVKSLSKRV